MKKKHSLAFTLAEIMIVFTVIGLLIVAAIKPTIDFINSYLNRCMYYSAFTNLSTAVSKIVEDGCTAADLSGGICAADASIPVVQNSTTRGFCNRLTSLFNIIGAPSCSTTGTTTPVFTTTNGLDFYNKEANLTAVTFYTMYIDIDGSGRREKIIDKDLMAFSIAKDGLVLPLASSTAATTINYLSASVGYKDSTTNLTKWVKKGIPYKEAYCIAKGTYTNSTCAATDTALYNANCTANSCQVIVQKPGFMFFSK